MKIDPMTAAKEREELAYGVTPDQVTEADRAMERAEYRAGLEQLAAEDTPTGRRALSILEGMTA